MMKRFALTVMSILLLALVSSCVPIVSADFSINLKSEQLWDFDSTLVVSQTSASLLAIGLQDTAADVQQSGAQMEWQQLPADDLGNIPFKITMHNLTPEFVTTELFSSNITIETVNGQRQVRFTMVPYASGIQNYTFTLTGKRVISSNGQQTGSGTVTWTNPTSTMEAVLIEGRSGLSAGWVFFLLGAGLIVGAIYLYRRGQTAQRPAVPAYPDWNQTPTGNPPPTYYPVTQPNPPKQPPAQPVARPAETRSPGSTPAPSNGISTEVIPAKMPEAAARPTPAQPAAPESQPPAESFTTTRTAAFCTSCGAKIPPGAGFCPACGAKTKLIA